jgi:hypothetical protein
MALEKSIDTEYGIPAIYWTIASIKIDRVNICADIEISGFPSKEAEIAKSIPIAKRFFHINFVKNTVIENTGDIPDQEISQELIEIFNTVSTFGYSLVKQSKNFTDSKNV